mgnify:CR=1 FL=1
MWTQITCLANDEQSIPQRWQRVAVPLPPQCYEKRDSQVRKYLQYIWGTGVLFERRKRDRREKLYHSGVVTRLTAQEALKGKVS